MGVLFNTASPQEIAKPSATVPGTGAQTLVLFNNTSQGWVVLMHLVFTYVATAATGGITPTFAIKDQAGNTLWTSAAQTAIAAGTTGVEVLGGGLPASSSATFSNIPIPDFCFIPPGGQLVATGSPAAATDTYSAFGVMSG